MAQAPEKPPDKGKKPTKGGPPPPKLVVQPPVSPNSQLNVPPSESTMAALTRTLAKSFEMAIADEMKRRGSPSPALHVDPPAVFNLNAPVRAVDISNRITGENLDNDFPSRFPVDEDAESNPFAEFARHNPPPIDDEVQNSESVNEMKIERNTKNVNFSKTMQKNANQRNVQNANSQKQLQFLINSQKNTNEKLENLQNDINLKMVNFMQIFTKLVEVKGNSKPKQKKKKKRKKKAKKKEKRKKKSSKRKRKKEKRHKRSVPLIAPTTDSRALRTPLPSAMEHDEEEKKDQPIKSTIPSEFPSNNWRPQQHSDPSDYESTESDESEEDSDEHSDDSSSESSNPVRDSLSRNRYYKANDVKVTRVTFTFKYKGKRNGGDVVRFMIELNSFQATTRARDSLMKHFMMQALPNDLKMRFLDLGGIDQSYNALRRWTVKKEFDYTQYKKTQSNLTDYNPPSTSLPREVAEDIRIRALRFNTAYSLAKKYLDGHSPIKPSEERIVADIFSRMSKDLQGGVMQICRKNEKTLRYLSVNELLEVLDEYNSWIDLGGDYHVKLSARPTRGAYIPPKPKPTYTAAERRVYKAKQNAKRLAAFKARKKKQQQQRYAQENKDRRSTYRPNNENKPPPQKQNYNRRQNQNQSDEKEKGKRRVSKSEYNMAKKKCYTCGRYGHFARDCRTHKRNYNLKIVKILKLMGVYRPPSKHTAQQQKYKQKAEYEAKTSYGDSIAAGNTNGIPLGPSPIDSQQNFYKSVANSKIYRVKTHNKNGPSPTKKVKSKDATEKKLQKQKNYIRKIFYEEIRRMQHRGKVKVNKVKVKVKKKNRHKRKHKSQKSQKPRKQRRKRESVSSQQKKSPSKRKFPERIILTDRTDSDVDVLTFESVKYGKLKFIADTGATVSCVGANFLKNNARFANAKIDLGKRYLIADTGNGRIKLDSYIYVDLMCKGRPLTQHQKDRYRVKLYVAEHLDDADTMILGNSDLKRLGFSLNRLESLLMGEDFYENRAADGYDSSVGQRIDSLLENEGSEWKHKGREITMSITENDEDEILDKLDLPIPSHQKVYKAKQTEFDKITEEIIQKLVIHMENASVKEQAKILLKHYQAEGLYAKNPVDVGCIKTHSFKIKMKKNHKIFNQKYPVNYRHRAELKKQIDELLKAGLIRRSNSQYGSPITCVPKPDGSTRFCLDSRGCNENSESDSYPLPNARDLFHKFRGCKVFSKLDIRSGYWNMPVDEESTKYMAFHTPWGLFEWLRMTFGFKGAAPAFQRWIDSVFQGLDFVVCYLDDIFVYSKSDEEHLEHLNIILERCHKANIKLRLSKSILFAKKLTYLGRTLFEGGTTINESFASKCLKLPAPRSKSEVRPFISTYAWLREYIYGFAEIAEPIMQMTKKNTAFRWGEAQKRAHAELNRRLAKAPILRFPDITKKFYLFTDASDIGIGAALMQRDENGRYYPVAFGSKLLTETERNWHISEKELYSAIYFIEKFRKYLMIQPFVLFVDHRNLEFLFQQTHFKDSGPKYHRWTQRLAEFTFIARWIPAQFNFVADYLSRYNALQQTEDFGATKDVYEKRRDDIYEETDLVGDDSIDGIRILWLRANPLHELEPLQPKEKSKCTSRTTDRKERKRARLFAMRLVREADDEENVKDTLRRRHKGRRNPIHKLKPLIEQSEEKKEAVEAMSVVDDVSEYHPAFDEDLPSDIPQHSVAVRREEQKANENNNNENRDTDDMIEDEEQTYDINAYDATATVNLNMKKLFDVEELKKMQWNDYQLQPHIARLRRVPPNEQSLYRLNDNGILVVNDGSDSIIAPPPYIHTLLYYFHNMRGHHDPKTVTEEILKRFYFDDAREIIRDYVRSCHACQVAKTTQNKAAGFASLFPAKYPNEQIAIDIAGPLPRSKRGNTHIIGIIDRFSRFTRLIAVPQTDALTVARALYTHWFALFGVPTKILSDRGTQFTGRLFVHLLESFKVIQSLTSPYHPQTDGMVERRFRFVKERLRLVGVEDNVDYFTKEQAIWDDILPTIEFNTNTKVTRALKFRPFEVFMGRTPRLPVDIMLNLRRTEYAQPEQFRAENANLEGVERYTAWMRANRALIMDAADQNQAKYDRQRTKYYNERHRQPDIRVDDKVMIYVGDRWVGNERKLKPNWRPGYTVTDITNNDTLVHMTWDEDPLVVERYHIAKVARYEPRTQYFTTADQNLVEEEAEEAKDALQEVEEEASDAHEDADAKEAEIGDHQREIEDRQNQKERAERHSTPNVVADSADLVVEAVDPELPDEDLLAVDDDADVLRGMGVMNPIPVNAPAERARMQSKPIPLLTDKGNRIPPDTENLIREFDLDQFVDDSALHRPPQIDSDIAGDIPLPPIPGTRKRKRDQISAEESDVIENDKAEVAAVSVNDGDAKVMEVEEKEFRGEPPSKRQRLKWLTALRSHSRIAPQSKGKRNKLGIFSWKKRHPSKSPRLLNIK